MLSSVLNSSKAIKMNINIMRAFVALKQQVLDYKYLEDQLKKIGQVVAGHDKQLNQIYLAIETLLRNKAKQEAWKENRGRIGFKK
jgi:hypothetical protein